jgi:adenylylsulfate kinase
MPEPTPNIHPVSDRLLQRSDKEALLRQKAVVIWMTGLSGSGKSTIAIGLERKLYEKGIHTMVLDGDNVRTGLNNNLGFSEEDRKENTREIRDQARSIIGNADFLEVYINTPLEVCEKRDVKGLYKKARAGEIPDFTGISSPFEAPEHPEIEIKTQGKSIDESVEELFTAILPKIKP